MPLFIFENNIEDNIKIIKEKTNKSIIAVIKNNAYELNSKKIIQILKKNKVNFFAFEKLKEYIQNKQDLNNSSVLIMESLTKNQIESIDTNNVRISINSVIDAIRIKDIQKKIIVHIRVDTGMNRLGLRTIEELNWVKNLLQENELIKLEGLYTHFSSDVNESKYYQKQYNLFEKFLKNQKFEIIHANSTKTLHQKLIGNYVRIGMAMYGYHQPNLPLKPIISYKIRPCNLFYPKYNKKVSYFQKKTNKFIGVIPIGYHDINLDKISNIYYKNQKLEILGKSCMNHTHFIANDKINYLSWLSIFPTNGIIDIGDEYNWYLILSSLKTIPKTYLRRKNYDIPKVLKCSGKTRVGSIPRKRSN